MNYSAIKPCDIANGPGVRVSLFVSGCTRHCPGCFNSQAWDFNAGRPFTAETENEIIGLLRRPYISGLSVLGGEPFEKASQAALVPFLRRVRRELPGKSVWCWSGFTLAELRGKEMLGLLDVLVDGPFIAGKRDISLLWRGSSNQTVNYLANS